MKQRFLLFLLALCIAGLVAPLQSQDRSTATWYFGNGGGLSFLTDPPTILAGGRTAAIEGTSVICDSVTGATIAYTDASTIWRGDHTVAALNVGGQVGSSTQAGVFVRHPGDPTIIYLFTVEDTKPNAEARVTTCTYIGGVFTVGATQTLLTGVCEKVTATQACDGVDYWVIIKMQSGVFVSYRVSRTNGFQTSSRVNSAVGLPVTAGDNMRGEMKVSPDGRWLAAANEAVGTELCRFNNSTGAVTAPQQFDLGEQRYGLSFSPNSQLLYVNSGWKGNPTNVIFQFDLTGTPVSSTRINVGTIAGNLGGGCMMIAPNGRIYVARNQGLHLGAIQNPDVRGAACNYNDTEIAFAANTIRWGLPNVPQNYFVPRFAGDDTSACEGSTVRLGIPALPGYSYQWSPAIGLNNATLAQPTLTVNGSQRFDLVVTDPNGCTINRSVDVTSRSVPTITISRDTLVCAGSPASLRATGPAGSTISWMPSPTLSSTTGSPVTATPVVTTQYVAIVTDATGCRGMDTVLVTVHTPAKPDIAPTQSVDLCQGSTRQLSVGNMLGTVLWSTGATTPNISVNSGGTYTVAVTDSLNCIGRDTVTVVMLAQPPAAATGGTEICAGRSAPLQASGGVSYLWTPAAGLNDPTSANPIASPTQTTRYDVEVTGANGCKDTASATVTVRPTPAPTINQVDTTICGCDSIVLTASPGFTNYLWSDSSTTQSIVVRNAGSYSVVVTDDLGCMGTSSVVRIDTFATFTDVSTLIIPYAAPDGVRVNLQVIIKNWLALAPCFGDSISWIVEMQSGVLAPATEEGRGVLTDSGVRIVRGVSRWDRVKDVVIKEIPYIVTLGDTTLTNITLRDMRGSICTATWQGPTASFGVEEICRTGNLIRRYLSPAKFTGILAADPNPANDAVSIRLRLDTQQTYHLELRDVLGQVVMQTAPTAGGPGVISVPIDVGSLPAGKYIITLVAGAERSGYLLEVL